MKKITLQLATGCLLALAISFSSCSKEGPQGPQGEQGLQGAQGSAGVKGDKGEPGTANVIYSEWMDVAFAADTVHDGAIIDTIGFYATIEAPKLDLNILNTGLIKVFFNAANADDPFIFPLPYFSPYLNLTLEPNFSIGSIDIYSNLDVSSFIGTDNKHFQQFRYVLVPGGVAARKAGPVVDWNNYNAVKKYLSLND